MDGADRTQRDAEDLGLSSSLPLRVARARHEVLCVVSVGAGKRWREDDSTAAQKPEPECVRGALGPLGKAGVLVQSDSAGGRFAVAGPDRVQPPLSPGTEPSRKGLLFPDVSDKPSSSGRSIECRRRMNIFTIRGQR